jgi:hypothetical protein
MYQGSLGCLDPKTGEGAPDTPELAQQVVNADRLCYSTYSIIEHFLFPNPFASCPGHACWLVPSSLHNRLQGPMSSALCS